MGGRSVGHLVGWVLMAVVSAAVGTAIILRVAPLRKIVFGASTSQ